MEGSGIIWLLIFIIAFQPVIRQRMIENMRKKWIRKIEKKRNSRVIMIVHRQETMGLLGFPLFRFLNMEDSEQVLRAIEMTDENKPIDLVLHTPGGMVLASYQIARAIAHRKGTTRVIVPHYAMSGGTLIALAADEVIMSPNAVLGPVDPQLGKYPAPSLVQLRNIKDVNQMEDETLIYADMAQKAIHQLQKSVKELMQPHYDQATIDQTIQTLIEGGLTHDYPISPSVGQNLGLNISTDLPSDFSSLMSMYQMPVQRQGSVEYVQREVNSRKSE